MTFNRATSVDWWTRHTCITLTADLGADSSLSGSSQAAMQQAIQAV